MLKFRFLAGGRTMPSPFDCDSSRFTAVLGEQVFQRFMNTAAPLLLLCCCVVTSLASCYQALLMLTIAGINGRIPRDKEGHS